jgi:hypothetical protein
MALIAKSTTLKNGLSIYGTTGLLIVDVYEDPDTGAVHVYTYKGVNHRMIESRWSNR